MKDKFLEVLFNEGERTCFATGIKDNRVSENPSPSVQLFTINPLHPTKDLNPTANHHSEFKPRRADHNVVGFRNFLIEIDDMPLKSQLDYVLSKIPVTSIVYSGSKSYHFIISLKEDLPDIETYKLWAKNLLKCFPLADSSTKNPSRLSRFPNVIRKESNRKQELIFLGSRIDNSLIEDIIFQKHESSTGRRLVPAVRMPNADISSILNQAIVAPESLIDDLGLIGRNALFFYLGNRLKEFNRGSKHDYEVITEIYNSLQDKSDFDIDEALTAARIEE